VGRYAADAHAIFCEGKYRETQPSDHALNWYRSWLMGLDAPSGGGEAAREGQNACLPWDRSDGLLL
jgi:hypothetical protein